MISNNDKREKAQSDESGELKIYGAPGSTLQSPEEHRHDQSVDPRKDSTISVSNDDLRKTDIEKMQEQLDGKRGDIEEIDDTLSNER
jgi:hypothetical protein